MIKFWGVRGSNPCTGAEFAAVGGETSCVEVRAGGQTIILDLGSGARALGVDLLARGVCQATVLLTHLHIDHICGLFGFAPFMRAGFSLDIRGASPGMEHSLKTLAAPPYWPLTFSDFPAAVSMTPLEAGASWQIGEVRVSAAELSHPNSAVGYRLDFNGKSLCYITDTQVLDSAVSDRIIRFVKGADFVIYDCTFEEDELADKLRWGHSSWREGRTLLAEAGAGKLLAFHHAPTKTDAAMAQMEAAIAASGLADKVIVAKQGLEITDF
ncbi:MBL fold metallo-hydrolase [Alphaproteobacteria bacterium]|nr:MBL fold metallo-hydrolase [Alphaproteobacteria bacterium]